jgi:polysaccharide biosynthesis protein PslG
MRKLENTSSTALRSRRPWLARAVIATVLFAAPAVLPGSALSQVPIPPICVVNCEPPPPEEPPPPPPPKPHPPPEKPPPPKSEPPRAAPPRPDPPCSTPRSVSRRPPRRVRGSLLIGQHAGLRYERGRALCKRARLARGSGAGLVREDFSWSKIEPRPGQYDWERHDRIVAAAAHHGLTVLPLLDETPRWVARSSTAIPADHGSYARFVRRVVARYGPGGAFWRKNRELPRRAPRYFELYNEPYLPASSDGRPDPANYARLVRAAVSRARRTNSRVRFLIEAETTYTADYRSYRDWMAGMYAAVPNLGDYYSAVAVHPYSVESPGRYTPGDSRWQTRRLEEVRRFLVDHGDGEKGMWLTEIGWPTCPGDSTCVSERAQAAYLRSTFKLARTRWRDYVDAVFIYSLVDYRPSRGPSREGYFGVLRADGRPKPAWRTLRRASRPR